MLRIEDEAGGISVISAARAAMQIHPGGKGVFAVMHVEYAWWSLVLWNALVCILGAWILA